MKTQSAALLLLFGLGCGDPAELTLPSRPAETEGTITRREARIPSALILVDETPGTPYCAAGNTGSAVYYFVNSAVFVARRSANGGLRTFSPDSLQPGLHVRAWLRRDLPILDSCPPMASPEAIEVLP